MANWITNVCLDISFIFFIYDAVIEDIEAQI